MQYGVMLLDKASKICGSDEKLAKRLGTSRPNISLMRAGKRAISPVTAAELADIANEDVTYAVNMAMLESVRGTPKENRIRDILGKALAAGAVAMLATGSNAGQSGFINSAAKSTYDVTKIYIVSIRRWLAGFARKRHVSAQPC